MRLAARRAWITGIMIAAALSAGSASAATYTVDQTFSIYSSAHKRVTSNFKQTQSASDQRDGRAYFRGFDSRLGELTRVVLGINWTQKSELSVKAQTSLNPFLRHNPQVWAMGDGDFRGSLFGRTLASSTLGMKSECEDSFSPGIGGGCNGSEKRSTSRSSEKSYRTQSSLDKFVGRHVGFDLFASANLSVSCDPILFPNCRYPEAEYDNWITGSIWVKYYYNEPRPTPPQPPEPPVTAVPVPPALPLLGMALGLLALTGRRRKS